MLNGKIRVTDKAMYVSTKAKMLHQAYHGTACVTRRPAGPAVSSQLQLSCPMVHSNKQKRTERMSSRRDFATRETLTLTTSSTQVSGLGVIELMTGVDRP